MKRLLLYKIVVLTVCIGVSLPVFGTTFSSMSHPKSNGLNVQITYPDDWKLWESDRQDTIKQMTSPAYKDRLSSICGLQVFSFGKKLSTGSWDKEFREKYDTIINGIMRGAGDNTKLLSYDFTSHAEQPGMVIEFTGSFTKDRQDFYFHSLLRLFGYKDNGVGFSCMSVGKTQKQADTNFTKDLPTFLEIGDSILLLDMYNHATESLAVSDTQNHIYTSTSALSAHTALSYSDSRRRTFWENLKEIAIQLPIIGPVFEK